MRNDSLQIIQALYQFRISILNSTKPALRWIKKVYQKDLRNQFNINCAEVNRESDGTAEQMQTVVRSICSKVERYEYSWKRKETNL